MQGLRESLPMQGLRESASVVAFSNHRFLPWLPSSASLELAPEGLICGGNLSWIDVLTRFEIQGDALRPKVQHIQRTLRISAI